MANLIFLPIADSIQSGSYLLYDGACGTGGMLTVAEETLFELALRHGRDVRSHLYGQEISGETYAICKADMLLKGEGEHASHIVGGPEWSTLSRDAFPALEFDFMLSNPPYGKSWKKDLEAMGGKDGMRDPRFKLSHNGDAEFSLVTRSSDGQMLFLPLNLFYNTGIATYIWVLTNRKPEHRRGQVQLIDATQWSKPLRKNLGKKNCELSPEDIETICKAYLDFAPTEQSKIFSNAAFGYWKVTVERPLRLYSQLTLKAIETLRFASGDEELRSAIYDEFGDTLHTDFATVEAKLTARLSEWGSDENGDSEEEDAPKRTLPEKKKRKLLDAKTWERDGRLVETATLLREELGGGLYEDHNHFRGEVAAALDRLGRKVSATDLKAILQAVSWRVETAPPVIAKVYKAGKAEANPMYGLYEAEIDGKRRVVEYEPDSELRDTEQVSFLEAPESGQLGGLPTDATTREGVERFIRREVLPYVPDAWIRDDWKVGYEISFTRHFYKPQPLRSLEEIRADIVALEEETDGLLEEVLAGGAE